MSFATRKIILSESSASRSLPLSHRDKHFDSLPNAKRYAIIMNHRRQSRNQHSLSRTGEHSGDCRASQQANSWDMRHSISAAELHLKLATGADQITVNLLRFAAFATLH